MENELTFKCEESILKEVVNAITAGIRNVNIIDYLNNKKIEVNEEELSFYLIEAYDYFIKNSFIDRDYELGKALDRLNNLYMNSFRIQDYKSCLAIQKEINGIIDKVDFNQKPNVKKNKSFNLQLKLGKQ